MAGGAVFGVGALGLDRLSFVPCGFRWLTGLPCPLCFGTRATYALSQGAIGDAFALNPLVPLGALAIVISGALLLADREPPWLAPGRQPAVFKAALAAVGINWFYLIFHSG